MKNQNSMNLTIAGIQDLSEIDLNTVNGGGGFFETAAYILGATARIFYEFGKAGGEYQASLPPKHKK